MTAPRVCRLDFETRSRIDLKKRGTYVYAADPSTEVLMASYSFDDGATIKRWRMGEPCPADLAAHVKAGGEIHAWNAQFERLIWWNCLRDWPRPNLEQFKCTAAVARALSLPGSLDRIGQALQLPAQKSREGTRLIKLFCVPQADGSFTPPEGPDFERFHDYCDQDVRTEGSAAQQMIPLSTAMWAAYHLGERINDRGIRIDTVSAFSALRVVQQSKEAVDAELFRLTDGAVEKHSQGARLVAWLQSRGVPAEKAARQDLEVLLEDPDTPDDAKLAMTLRLLASKAAVGKLNTMLARVSKDGRSRGNFLWHGAGTGRFSSLGWQAHNLARPRIIFAKAAPDPGTLFRAIRHGDASLLPFLYGDELGKPMHLLADAMRSFLWADPGKELMVADYSGIEGALTAWFCREEWKLEAMHELLTPAGKKKPDMYLRAAGGIFGVPAESIPKSDDRRQVGKVSELSCFAADTLILTRRGVCRITEVLDTDELWDGVEWVRHSGVVARGVRPVVDVDGIGATADHLFLVAKAWKPAQRIVSSAATLSRALATGTGMLPWFASRRARQADSPQFMFAATVAKSSPLPWPTCNTGAPRGAEFAGWPQRAALESDTLVTTTLCQTRPTDTGCWAASLPQSTGARTRTIEAGATTERAASECIGAQTAERFLPISSRLLDGINPAWSLTASTLIEATNRATCASSRSERTWPTGAPWPTFKSASLNWKDGSPVPVYDILNAGPRNRFTTFSRSGALIAHNCGYEGGVSAFYSMARNYSLDLDGVYPVVWAAASDERRAGAEKRLKESTTKGHAATKLLSREAWLAAELVKVGWRATHPAIVEGWKILKNAAAEAVENPGTRVAGLGATFLVQRGFLWCLLPSGRVLAYGNPSIRDVEVPWADQTKPRDQREKQPAVTVLGTTGGKLKRYALYGGLLMENIIQALAWDILNRGMHNAERLGYATIMHVHDEVVAEVPRGWGDEDAFKAALLDLEPWCTDLPLGVGDIHRMKRYRKA